MSDHKPAQAEVQKMKQFSTIWLVPLVAVAIGIWMLVQFVGSKGPVVTLKLNTAEGIEVGKTEIKSLNVKVGVINSVKLSDDYSYIIATAQMNKDAARMLKEDTLFWVVKPRIGKEGISGLETLLSGAYLELQPGVKEKEKLDFTVLETPPVAPPDAKGLRLVLTHREAGKLSVTDPVLYEGFTVGRVEKVSFDPETRKANYQLFIFQPYDSLIRKHTKFWLTSGVDLQMSAEGFNLKIGSVESLITGGVSFRVPKGAEPGEQVTTQLKKFKLYNNLKQVRERVFDQYLEYVMMFDESVRGLNSGAPVEYRGIRIGTVKKVPMELPSKEQGFSTKQIPVLVRIELGRIYNNVGEADLLALKRSLDKEFNQGLRASLKTGSFLTGALFIDTEVYEKADNYDVKRYKDYDIFPTQAGGFAEIQKQVTTLLDKFNNLPLEQTLGSLNNSLVASQQTMRSAQKVADSLNKLLSQKDTQAIPADVRKSLQEIQTTLNGFGPDAAPYQNLEQALARFENVMAELEPVLRQLNEKPNSLIFSGESTRDPIPAARGQK
ncbi:paraquat-inducible protein B [Photobacterium jeanii]|uniref:Paraquat-inducible protein B n=1 Tax=Photobacterium jeanii TaxID=858640 RepID=A0A178K173_9GAMM|nr:intermembrane transport protein PqiB [Photobacterium jeanii]OAN11079.1 paraquat-inducible protein B [Photobacterium jeanii]PST90593.1 intermembrane transport protein PqiB [Photobacterium jeanii]